MVGTELIYYNQINYNSIPYASSLYPNATVKTSGCGVCCASMIVENLTGESFPPEESAKFSINCGARAATGTDMAILAKALCKRFKLEYQVVSDIAAAARAISGGAMAVANTKGGTNGLFSTSGHYVVLAEYQNSSFTVLDPYLYSGKFKTSTRKGKVKQNGNILQVSKENVAADCKKYYIFKGVNKKMESSKTQLSVEEAKGIIKEKAGLADGTIDFLYNYRYGDDLLVKLAKAML